MTKFENKAISASAGSGKTFRLAHRYMGLLARGIPPDRICALTFSRKAAGEIFDSIVRNLTRAAQNAQSAERASKYMEAGPVPAGKFLAALRCFLENLHGANIGTIDSFIAAIIRAFPLELGLNDLEFRLMDGDSADAESFREGIISAVCNSKHVNKTGTNIFLEVFKQATLGAEKKTFTDNLNGFLSNYRAAFLRIPAEDAWGNPARIWKQEPWWRPPPKAPNGKELERILQLILDNPGWDKRMPATMAKLINNLKDFDYDSEWAPDLFLDGAIQSQLIAKLDAPSQDGLTIQYARKEYLIPANVFKLLRALYHNLFHVQFNRLCQRTRGILGVIAMYEKEYEQALLQTGRMTFTDAQLLLSPRGFASGGSTISRCRQPQDGRIFIDYRLDSRIDHWLLDEFQDTSNLQWQALENLLDEILQDDSDTRSFFYVGDVKQTIYRWRGGNPDLFNSVLSRYGKKIINESLNKTQRSAQPIIDTVNRVFASLPETQAKTSEPAISRRVLLKWNSAWKEHE
ncbi:MAG: UvrD-helicase domain-containing protein, partial [Kiritimatiellia bacterium]|nr:UvrD-helicase domain-containing protein [Kiritimatiellia bacterium]